MRNLSFLIVLLFAISSCVNQDCETVNRAYSDLSEYSELTLEYRDWKDGIHQEKVVFDSLKYRCGYVQNVIIHGCHQFLTAYRTNSFGTLDSLVLDLSPDQYVPGSDNQRYLILRFDYYYRDNANYDWGENIFFSDFKYFYEGERADKQNQISIFDVDKEADNF